MPYTEVRSYDGFSFALVLKFERKEEKIQGRKENIRLPFRGHEKIITKI